MQTSPTRVRRYGRQRIFGVILCVLALANVAVYGQTNTYAGLWVGEATINRVSEAHPVVPDLALDLGVSGLLVKEPLVLPLDAWRYDDTGIDRGTAWRALAYNDSAWKVGTCEFGFGDGDEHTVLLSTNKPTTYFRHRFSVTNPSAYSSLEVSLLADDAVVVYLNGIQIRRSNLAAVYNFNSLALSEMTGAAETQVQTFSVPSNLLGTDNVLTVELHQFRAADTDASFALSLSGVVADPQLVTLMPVGNTWRYDASGQNLGSAWRAPGYDDSGWSSGAAPLGYGNPPGQVATVVGYGTETNRNRTTYFRTSLVVGSTFSDLDLLLMRDDGVVVYINGIEVLRDNMPGGTVSYATPPLSAVTGASELEYAVHRVSAVMLVPGTNVVGVEVHQAAGELGQAAAAVTPAPAAFEMRLLLHVDAAGTPRFLKEVIQMWEEGTFTPAPGGLGVEIAQPGHYVLVTDDTQLSRFLGVAQRDGVPVGRRISCVGIDFAGNELTMTGTVGPTGTASVTTALPADFRTNPFRHKYHPSHKDRNIAVTREIGLEFSGRYPPDPDQEAAADVPPGWGTSILGGMYRETLRGLHHRDIDVSGWFELQRISTTAVLNE